MVYHKSYDYGKGVMLGFAEKKLSQIRRSILMSFFRTGTVIIAAFLCMVEPCLSSTALAEALNAPVILSPDGVQRPVSYEYNPLYGPNYPSLQNSYFTDDYGNILMIVNVLGEVNKPGQIVVRESTDFPSILALAGGLKHDANLTKVLVARQELDKNGAQAYRIDLKKYFKHGDRSTFIALKPNDTIIVPEKGMSLNLLSKVLATALSGFSIFQILENSETFNPNTGSFESP